MQRLNRHVVCAITAAGAVICACSALSGCASAKSPAPNAPALSATSLARNYVEGETARYLMTGSNQGREHTITYTAEAHASGVSPRQQAKQSSSCS